MKSSLQQKSTNTVVRRNRDKKSGTKPSIAVIGLGYVGLPLALRADQLDHEVIGIDIDASRVDELRRRKVPSSLNSEDSELARRHTMVVSSDVSMLAGVDVFIVCVPTPVSVNHEPDLEPLISACRSLAPYVRKGTLIVVESTVNPGVCDEILIPMISSIASLQPEQDYLFAYCPERINPGDPKWTVTNIPRVLGAAGEKSARAARSLYRGLIDAPIHMMDNVRSAEAVKITENSFRDINIAFVNELAMSFKKLGIDTVSVLEGAATKPFGFMAHYPGCGVGGHCIPVDPYYLIAYAEQNGFTHRFLKEARTVNNGMPAYTVSLLVSALEKKCVPVDGAKVALLGLAYKRDVPDDRESPSYVIRDELISRGIHVRSFDPYLEKDSSVRSLEDALRGADAAIIATDHRDFVTLTPQDFLAYGVDTVIDGRNCLNKEAFMAANVTYHGIGR